MGFRESFSVYKQKETRDCFDRLDFCEKVFYNDKILFGEEIMGVILGLACCLVVILKYAIANSIAYVIHKPWSTRITEHISVNAPREIFACLKMYANFRFEPDFSIVKDLPEHFLVICNHQSLLDIVVFFAYFRYMPGMPVRFISKKTLGGHVPLVSVMLKAGGHCIINREGGPTQMMKTLDTFSERVSKNKWIVVLFPEGTRTKTGNVGTFHAAGFRRLINNLKLPVAAFALDGGWQIRDLRKIISNLHSGSYKLKGLKVYPFPENKEEQIAVLDDAKACIENQLVEWRKEA